MLAGEGDGQCRVIHIVVPVFDHFLSTPIQEKKSIHTNSLFLEMLSHISLSFCATSPKRCFVLTGYPNNFSIFSPTKACISAADAAFQWQGRVDAFVHSAGIFPSACLSDTTDEMWSDCMRVHADAFFYLSRHLAPSMVKNGGGSLLAIASNYGMVGASDAAAYAASKAACIALCKSMALEYAKHNVRVNCVCPGATETPMIADNAEEYAKCSPSRELVQPLDVANAVLYLTSPAGRMIRGIELLVDGGETAGFHQGQRTQGP